MRHDSLTVSSNFQAFDQPVTFTWNVLLDPGPIRPLTSLSSQVRSTFYCRRADHASGRAKARATAGGQATPYQVRQVAAQVHRYKLQLEDAP